MDTKQAYESIIQALKRQLDAEMPLAKEADDTLVAKGLLYNPSEAAALFVDPIEGYIDRIAEEVSTESCNGHRYTVALYQRDASGVALWHLLRLYGSCRLCFGIDL